MAEPTGAAGERLVGSLLHGLSMLDLFDREHRTIGVGEMARALGLHKSSVSRLAATLAAAGYLEAAEGQGRYRLGRRLAALGNLAQEDTSVERVVLPHLQNLSWTSGDTGHLAVLDGTDARTTAIAEGWHTVRMHSWVGKRSPAYCSSMGKALLASLPEDTVRSLYAASGLPARTPHTITDPDRLLAELAGIRERGYAVDHEELELGLRCVAAPIAGVEGTVVASISISGPAQRLTPDVVPDVAAHVRWTAALASASLGAPGDLEGWPPHPTREPAPLPWVEALRPAGRRRPEANGSAVS